MRILLATDWNPLWGGAEIYATMLRTGLREAGDTVSLLTSSVSPEGRQVADEVAWSSDSRLAKSVLQIGNPFAAAKVRDVIRRFRPDVAMVNMFALYLSPSVLTAVGDLPLVVLVSDYKLICPTGAKLLPGGAVCTRPAGRACLDERCVGVVHWLRDQVRYRVMHEAVRGASRIIACSGFLQRALHAEGIESDVELLPVELPRADFRTRPDAAPLFVFVGRLDPEKGVDTAIRAFALVHKTVPSARLRIVGRGPLRGSLEALAHSLGVSHAVTFVGWKAPVDVEEELAQAWAMVAPSRWAEPFGLVAVESIVRGVPAIVSGHGGFAETVEHGASGLHVPPDDVAALAGAMEQIAHGAVFPAHRLEPAVVARVRERYHLAGYVERLRARFTTLIGS